MIKNFNDPRIEGTSVYRVENFGEKGTPTLATYKVVKVNHLNPGATQHTILIQAVGTPHDFMPKRPFALGKDAAYFSTVREAWEAYGEEVKEAIEHRKTLIADAQRDLEFFENETRRIQQFLK